jgi:hypothetical protein
MTQGCPAFTPDTIHIKLSSNVQTAEYGVPPYPPPRRRKEEASRDGLPTAGKAGGITYLPKR